MTNIQTIGPDDIQPGSVHWHDCAQCGHPMECNERHSAMPMNWVCEWCLRDGV